MNVCHRDFVRRRIETGDKCKVSTALCVHVHTCQHVYTCVCTNTRCCACVHVCIVHTYMHKIVSVDRPFLHLSLHLSLHMSLCTCLCTCLCAPLSAPASYVCIIPVTVTGPLSVASTRCSNDMECAHRRSIMRDLDREVRDENVVQVSK